MKEQQDYYQGSLFEEDYLVRTLGQLVNSADIALTELVANSWDAGASRVDIYIPETHDDLLIIEDDGTGLTSEEFHSRWMKLGYNRLKHQGKKVEFPVGKNGNRLAYGRNGIGRHGLLCFNKEYRVITTSNHKKSTFIVTTLSESQPFVIKEEHKEDAEGNGTRLEVNVSRNLPKEDRILEIITARFLHDPQFTIRVNGKSMPWDEHIGLIDLTEEKVDDVNLTLRFFDTQKAAKSTLYQGVAFWQSRRLVGEPSWILGDQVVIDGRTRFAKQYSILVETDDLAEYVKNDWTGFSKNEVVDKVYSAVIDYAQKMFSKVAVTHLEETKSQVKEQYSATVKDLSPLGRYEVDEAIESVVRKNPTIRVETVSLIVETVIDIEKTRAGKELLLKIASLSDEDIEGLNRLLDQWSVKDALCVLDEIDRRLSVIEAIKKLSSDKEVDELKTLHPLITEARWLFGPEFDSPEYIANRQLKTAVKQLWGVDLGVDVFDNQRKRPDLVIKGNSTFSITGTDSLEGDPPLATINRILIIELKKGGFALSRNERNQAQEYVEEFVNCGSIIGKPFVHAFVVGDTCKDKISEISTVDRGRIQITTFAQLVDTAEKRFFRLRDKLNERYDGIPGMDLYRKTIQPDLGL